MVATVEPGRRYAGCSGSPICARERKQSHMAPLCIHQQRDLQFTPSLQVILFTPLYDSYVPIVERAGAKAVVLPLQAPDWHFDREEVAAAFSSKTKLIVVNTPHNPTGKVRGMRIVLEIVGLNPIIFGNSTTWQKFPCPRPSSSPQTHSVGLHRGGTGVPGRVGRQARCVRFAR